ncbi:prephenate dehydrogenase [Isoptericola jiangsuensis]|uniref:prephenate dehydrogenase n=1 Tax=Isoptericola jiangsuensis TaxID=548579 RepID=UPI003AAAA6DD
MRDDAVRDDAVRDDAVLGGPVGDDAAAGGLPDASIGRVAVVGLGLIGGSLARLLTLRGVDVVATDVLAASREAARRTGLAVADDVAACVEGAGLVVLAVPLRTMTVVAEQVAAHAPAGATVTDVGSVKAPVRESVVAAGLGDRYVGAHPMSGTEHSGFEASDADLLDQVAWAVTVGDQDGVDADRLAQVLALVTGPCRGRATVLTDDVHDEAAALVSHVPHVLATQLLNAATGAPVARVAQVLAAGSFRDGTRVAYTDPARTEAMVTANAAWVAPALRKVVRDLEAVVRDLEANGAAHEFFHAADPARAARRAGSVRAPGPDAHPVQDAGLSQDAQGPDAGSVVPREEGWPAVLVRRCLQGAFVVEVSATHARLAA